MKKSKTAQDLFNPRKWFEGETGPAEQMALGLGAAMLALSIISDLRGFHLRAEKLSIIATLVVVAGMFYPRVLLPLEKILRNAVLGFAWLNTKIVLTLVYYLVFTPFGLVLKLFGKKLIDKDFRKNVESYFEAREEKECRPEQDEMQF